MTGRIRVRPLVRGEAEGPALTLEEPISFWGGVDPVSGRIVEGGHPQAGNSVTGRMLVLSHGKGSSSASSVLAEMIRAGSAPAALILESADPILVLGAVVAEEIYGKTMPVVERPEVDAEGFVPRGRIRLTLDGWMEFD